MRLGTQTGSLTNHILSRAVIGQPEPVEGMGATILSWTDRHAATIIHVTNAHAQTVIYVREDTATRTDKNGMSESQSYAYAPNPQGRLYTFRRTKSGTWEEVSVNEKTGRFNKTGGCGLRIGERAEYRDFSF
jgi:hypothetical protein